MRGESDAENNKPDSDMSDVKERMERLVESLGGDRAENASQAEQRVLDYYGQEGMDAANLMLRAVDAFNKMQDNPSKENAQAYYILVTMLAKLDVNLLRPVLSAGIAAVSVVRATQANDDDDDKDND